MLTTDEAVEGSLALGSVWKKKATVTETILMIMSMSLLLNHPSSLKCSVSAGDPMADGSCTIRSKSVSCLSFAPDVRLEGPQERSCVIDKPQQSCIFLYVFRTVEIRLAPPSFAGIFMSSSAARITRILRRVGSLSIIKCSPGNDAAEVKCLSAVCLKRFR